MGPSGFAKGEISGDVDLDGTSVRCAVTDSPAGDALAQRRYDAGGFKTDAAWIAGQWI